MITVDTSVEWPKTEIGAGPKDFYTVRLFLCTKVTYIPRIMLSETVSQTEQAFFQLFIESF